VKVSRQSDDYLTCGNVYRRVGTTASVVHKPRLQRTHSVDLPGKPGEHPTAGDPEARPHKGPRQGRRAWPTCRGARRAEVELRHCPDARVDFLPCEARSEVGFGGSRLVRDGNIHHQLTDSRRRVADRPNLLGEADHQVAQGLRRHVLAASIPNRLRGLFEERVGHRRQPILGEVRQRRHGRVDELRRQLSPRDQFDGKGELRLNGCRATSRAAQPFAPPIPLAPARPSG